MEFHVLPIKAKRPIINIDTDGIYRHPLLAATYQTDPPKRSKRIKTISTFFILSQFACKITVFYGKRLILEHRNEKKNKL